jgi:hypothetical protein
MTPRSYRLRRSRAAVSAFALFLATTTALVSSVSAPAGNGVATITADTFTDSCRDVSFHSSKDISYVEIHYADGRVVKDEDVTGPDFSIDGHTGDEIDFAIVKSGTTRDHFACENQRGDNPPTAVLERRAGNFDHQNPAGTWTDTDCHWDFVDNPGTTFCTYGSGVGESTVSFRGTGSTDPDGDIVSWSIDFGDGTTPASGTWATEPPVEVAHDYGQIVCVCTVVLTVTDSAGHSSSDPMLVDLDNDGFD